MCPGVAQPEMVQRVGDRAVANVEAYKAAFVSEAPFLRCQNTQKGLNMGTEVFLQKGGFPILLLWKKRELRGDPSLIRVIGSGTQSLWLLKNEFIKTFRT